MSASVPVSPHSAGEVLVVLLLCGLMGMIGQGIRAVLGLKNAASSAPQTGPAAPFDAAYFALSLMIGFIAGIVAGLLLDLNTFMPLNVNDMKPLLGIVAAGYAGADFIENAMAFVMPGKAGTVTPSTTQTSGPQTSTPQIPAAPLDDAVG